MSVEKIAEGLEGVVVTETRLSDVDGERGRLVIGGHDVEELGADRAFEDVVALLEDGVLPDAARRDAVRATLGRGRAEAWRLLGPLGGALEAPTGMDALRAGLARLATEDRSVVVGAAAVVAGAWTLARSGRRPLAPDPSLGHAEDYGRMATGSALDPARARALDTYLVTVADHGMNASTFAARVVASTGSDLVSAIVAAVGALKGPLHGGAPGPVLDMLDAIGAPDAAEAWLDRELSEGRRIMGMGHRVYRVRDPRAAVLEAATRRLERAGVVTPRLSLAQAVERAATSALARRHPSRALAANVEFYTAVLLDTIGLPREAFTPTFAVSRVAGWIAHVDEQRARGRLIRPASRYVGPVPARA